MNIQEVIFVSNMAVIIGLAIFVLGMFPSKNKVLCVIGISIMAIAMVMGGTASSFVIQTALQETQAQE